MEAIWKLPSFKLPICWVAVSEPHLSYHTDIFRIARFLKIITTESKLPQNHKVSKLWELLGYFSSSQLNLSSWKASGLCLRATFNEPWATSGHSGLKSQSDSSSRSPRRPCITCYQGIRLFLSMWSFSWVSLSFLPLA